MEVSLCGKRISAWGGETVRELELGVAHFSYEGNHAGRGYAGKGVVTPYAEDNLGLTGGYRHRGLGDHPYGGRSADGHGREEPRPEPKVVGESSAVHEGVLDERERGDESVNVGLFYSCIFYSNLGCLREEMKGAFVGYLSVFRFSHSGYNVFIFIVEFPGLFHVQ